MQTMRGKCWPDKCEPDKRDDNWLAATGRAMILSLAVVATAVVVVSCVFFTLDAGPERPRGYSSVTQCLVTPDGHSAVALWWNVPVTLQGWTHRLTFHRPGAEQPATTVMWPGIAPSCIAPAAIGGAIFIGDWNGSLYELSSLTGAARPRLIGHHRDGVVSLHASADGRHLVSLSPTAMCAWDLPTKQLRWQREGGHISAARIHPDSSRLLCGLEDGQVLEIDLFTGERTGSLIASPPPWPVYDLDVTADGKRVCVVHSTGEVRIVSGEPGQSSAAPAPFCHVGWPRYARFSPCGSLLAASAKGDEPDLQVWSLTSGQPLTTLRGHTSIVLGVSFAADGRLFSWGQDGSIRVWDALQGQMLRVIPLPAPDRIASDVQNANWPRATAASSSRDARNPRS